MRGEMLNVAVIAIATAALLLVTAETVLTASATIQQDFGGDGAWHDEAKTQRFEQIKSTILNALGMEVPPKFSKIENVEREYNYDHINSAVNVRESPQIICNETSLEIRCCRFPLVIDFMEIGWNFVISPKRVMTNYCSGSCDMTMANMSGQNHSDTQSSETDTKHCVSYKQSPVIISFYVNNTIRREVVANGVIESCRCS